MATLTQLVLDADGTKGVNLATSEGPPPPVDFYTLCNDAPDGLSSDWIANDQSEVNTEIWFSLSNVDSDFSSMSTLNIDVDVDAVDDGSSNDTCELFAQIFDADNVTTNPLTSEVEVGSELDTTRTQRNVAFGSLTGSKAQWDAAYIRFRWNYGLVADGDNVQVRLYGCDIDGTYATASADKLAPGVTVSIM